MIFFMTAAEAAGFVIIATIGLQGALGRRALLLFPVATVVIGLRLAHGHDFYIEGCCGGRDCAPVISVSYVRSLPPKEGELPQMVVTTEQGVARVPEKFPPLPSPDGRLHACMVPDTYGIMKVICLYMPAQS
jgi:hypothetical protein